MRSFVLLILFFTFGLNGFGQYQAMISSNKEWLVKTCEFGGCLYDYYYFSKDTLLGGRSYKILDGYHYNQNFYLREDIQLQQVFLAINEGIPVPKDYLIYDFGMSVGDSIYLQNPVSPVSPIEGYYTLDSIVNVMFEQAPRRVFYLHGTDTQNNYHQTKWIEGIGSTGLINTPGVLGDTATMAVLLCASENGSKIYSRKSNDTCYSNPVLDLEERNFDEKINIYFDQQRKALHFETLNSGCEIVVVNCNGSRILAYIAQEEEGSLDLSFLKKGLYVVSWKNNSQSGALKILIDR